MAEDQGGSQRYFHRRVRLANTTGFDKGGAPKTISEEEFLALRGPKVLLGEPGMGKTELITQASKSLGVDVVSAIRFMHSKRPALFLVDGRPLLIDGLDEAIARKDGNAVDEVLAQLEAIDLPDFLLTCRAREWQARTNSSLRQLYADVHVATLEPLTRTEAKEFLRAKYSAVDAEHVLSHLENHGIKDIYSNPLMLGAMGKVATVSQQLPSNRAALLDKVCHLIWPEHDIERRETDKRMIGVEAALSAAGAISAALLFAGADVVSTAGGNNLQEGEISLTDIETLPGADDAQLVLSSKLFISQGPGRAKPIHRLIAEYLGATWIASQTNNDRLRRRLLANIWESGGIPASLRGLHAWLAYHSPQLASDIVTADPFGVLRYGETSTLTTSQAIALFDALEALSASDPYFRAQDWNSHSAVGLLIPALEDRIRVAICSSQSNFHFRSLLIEGLKGAPLAANLTTTLESIVLASDRHYGEREAAADALMPFRSRDWWLQSITQLTAQGTEGSTRLAHALIDDLGSGVPSDLIISTILAELGLSICPLPKVEDDRLRTIRSYKRIVDASSASQLPELLDLLLESTEYLVDLDAMARRDIAGFGATMITKALAVGAVALSDAPRVWTWLRIVRNAQFLRLDENRKLDEELDRNSELRRAVQKYALYTANGSRSIWIQEVELRHRLIGLLPRRDDITWHVRQLESADNKDPEMREAWRDLMRLGFDGTGFDPALLAASRLFERGDTQLESDLRRIANPKKPYWQHKKDRTETKQARKNLIARETIRRLYSQHREALKIGDVPILVDPAKCYLGLFLQSDLNSPPDRQLANWIGDDLAADAFTGFEAVLHRNDIPSSRQISDGFAEGVTYMAGYPIVAGLLIRLRSKIGFDDLPRDVLLSGLLLALDGRCSGNRSEDNNALTEALDAHLFITPGARHDFARLWVEPSLRKGCEHMSALYKIENEEPWRDCAMALVPEWLSTFNDLPLSIELSMVDFLSGSGEMEHLADIARQRSNRKYPTDEETLSWFAIDLVARFEETLDDIRGVKFRFPNLIWYLRNRMQTQRYGNPTFTSIRQAQWIVEQFRQAWPYASLRGTSSGDENPHDATEFLREAIVRISDETSDEAIAAMQSLAAMPTDTYTDIILHMAAEQMQKRAEANYSPITPRQLGEILTDGAPVQIDDLKTLVIEELNAAQQILIGDDLDQVRDFWSDNGIPYDENRCRDRLTAIIGPQLRQYGILPITEADMPQTKRADLAFAAGDMQLPIEVKGQWHDEVWNAATGQLDARYLIDWRSQQRGIYCVLWFGDLPSKSGRRLKPPPNGALAPKSAEEMQRALVLTIPEARRHRIDVVVLDCEAGRPKTPM